MAAAASPFDPALRRSSGAVYYLRSVPISSLGLFSLLSGSCGAEELLCTPCMPMMMAMLMNVGVRRRAVLFVQLQARRRLHETQSFVTKLLFGATDDLQPQRRS